MEVSSFTTTGIVQFPLLSLPQYQTVKQFCSDWVFGLMRGHGLGAQDNLSLSQYHQWGKTIGVDHEKTLSAANRHTAPANHLREIILNPNFFDTLRKLDLGSAEIWDEGLGWLAFRLIRPDHSDGYPLSCKTWGPAKDVFSCYLPIFGLSPEQSPAYVLGSHLKDYRKELPKESKFCKDEFRLLDGTHVELFRPRFREGEALIYHPKTLHTEEIPSGNETRISLEFRFRVTA